MCPRGIDDNYDDEVSIASDILPNGTKGCPALRSLKLASLPNLLDDSIFAIGGLHSNDAGLKNLLVLDVRDCADVSSRALEWILVKCPSLVELDTRGTNGRVSRECLPSTLRFLNGRRLP